MLELYSRNRLYVSKEEQEIIKDAPILLAGCGVGSNIAECALRFGFENLTLVDGDNVEMSNLNRQNYISADIDTMKAEALCERLKKINPYANIKYRSEYISEENIESILDGHSVAINALDFTSNLPLKFDRACQKKKIHVLHPYNLGWGGLITVITPESLNLESLTNDKNFNELKMVEYVAGYHRFWGKPLEWLEKIISDYKAEEEILSPPQLAIASFIVAGMCTHLLFKITTDKAFRKFPECYLNTILSNE
ncbi:ThiF family adenylyltransferase [Chryseobacterium balustinum]|uniref:Sulfur carrier protein ThiS adenylyltransferase n=1 Tax=Chryseobacterium balustinum TaxID=246 RepID=A0AAX2IQ98_9FLAO|nr:ThiF family adenylyltransferase [Chryseobacterium balustinum]AZB28682.1 ThiF family adenylyltransferase [Chryseobacterium balustinum]SKC06909.1 ThiF family protein [Chryseobacterium balustinum]SQA91816.1 Sulfur carrier protein ThiS adenylyltransferase [Chryseobacterium balustinum]